MKIYVSNRQNGFTLIEIMVAVLLASFMMIFAFTQLSSSRSIYKQQETKLIIEENARYAFEVLQREIMQAGYFDSSKSQAEQPDALYFGGCGGVASCTFNGAANQSDQIAIHYRPDPGGDSVACNGVNIDAALGNFNTLVNVYSIVAVPNPDPNSPVAQTNTLFCTSYIVSPGGIATTNNTLTSAIIEGIEDIQFLYGRDVVRMLPDPFDPLAPNALRRSGFVEQYVSADRLLPDDVVYAIRISILVSTGTNDEEGFPAKLLKKGGQALVDNFGFSLADAPTYTPNQNENCFFNLCRTYTTTVNVPNSVGGIQ